MYQSRHILSIITSALILILTATACSEEQVTVNFRNPASRYTEAATGESTAMAQLRATFKEETGSYLLFTDTLQHYSLGIDINGDEQWFTETIDLTYSVGAEASGVTKYHYTLLNTDEEKRAAITYLRQYILPHLTGSIRPYAWLLASTITHNDNFGTYNDYAAIGQEVAAVACSLLPTLTDANKERYASQVMNILMGRLILNNSEAFNSFFAICEDLYTQQFADPSISTAQNNALLYQAGFITRGKDPGTTAVSNGFYPDRESDLTTYCRAAIANTEEKLRTTYANYPLVLRKFDLIMQTMRQIGYVF